jgi:hypothetical protein
VTRGQQLAVTVTCLVAAVTYAGAVTTWAMGLFVLPGVAGAALLASLLAARRMPGMAIGVVGALVLGWAELANIWTGTANGPAARSTAFAAGWTVIAVVLAYSRWPALFLAGVAGVVVGALVLGAGGEVRIVVVATAVCAALTLGGIERSRRNWSAPPRRGVALVLLSLLAGAAATGVVLLQAHKDPRPPGLVAQGRLYPGIKPAWTDPLASDSNSRAGRAAQDVTSPRPKPRTAAKPATRSHPAAVSGHTSRSIWVYVVAAIVLIVLVLAALIAARLLSTRLAWRRVRRRLAAGTPADQVTGAWAWTRMRLEACRLPLAVDVSPDSVAAGRAAADLPADVFMPLRELAAATTTAAFAYEQSITGAATASWAAAGRAEVSARERLTRRGRALLAFRGPAPAARPEDVASRRLTTTRAAIIVASGLGLCFATLARFGVFSSSNGVVQPVSTPAKSATATVSPPTLTVTTPTTPRPAHAAPAKGPSAPSQTLVPGDSGSQVKVLQRALAALGFSPGEPDGAYGLATQTAVARFQASKGLAVDGEVGPQTLVALRHALSRRSRR